MWFHVKLGIKLALQPAVELGSPIMQPYLCASGIGIEPKMQIRQPTPSKVHWVI